MSLLCLIALAACDEKPVPSTVPERVVATSTRTAAPPEATATAAPPEATGPDADGFLPDGMPEQIPAPGPKPPTIGEWESVKREISVLNSTALGCQTRMVREWLRVSCRPSGSRLPTTVATKQTSGQQAYAGMFGERASVVVQVVRGKSYSAFYTWNDGSSATLEVSWAAGSPRPLIVLKR